jgi:hypothetical protein
MTLSSRSTQNDEGNRDLIFATVRLYSILQLAVFIFYPFTRTFIRPVDGGIQGMMPSCQILTSRSTRNQHGDCGPILATVRLYRILQFAVFVFSSFFPTPTRSVVATIQDILPSASTLFFVRPGTSAATAPRSLPPSVCTESFNLLSSTDVHSPLRPLARPTLGSRTSCHLFLHCIFVRPGTSAATAVQSLPPCVCSASFSLLSSSTVHLPVRPLARPIWDLR